MIQKAYFQGNLINKDACAVPITDLALIRGFGVFDYFRIQKSIPVFIEDHIHRFFRSASQLGLLVPFSHEAVRRQIEEVIQINGLKDAAIRLILTGGVSDDGFSPGKPLLIVSPESLPMPNKALYKTGGKLILSEFKRELPETKYLNYLTAVSLQPRLKAESAAEILYHFNGWVTECSRSNFFMVKDNQLITPGEGILEGVTRLKVRQIALDSAIETINLAVSLTDLYNADEVFITSTTRRILPIIQLEDRIIGKGKIGPVTKILMKQMDALIDEYIYDYQPLAKS